MSASLRRTPRPLPGTGRSAALPARERVTSTSRAPRKTKLPSASQRSSAAASAGSSSGSSGVGASSAARARCSSRSASSSARERIRAASSSTARTSARTVRSPETRSAAASWSSGPSRTTAIQDSRTRVRAATPGVGTAAVAEGADPAGDVAAHHHHGVDDVLQPGALPDDLGGDGVDQERHVVGDDPQDRASVRGAGDVDGRRALRADLGQPQVAQGQAGELGRLVAEHLVGRLAPVVAVQEGGKFVRGAPGRQVGGADGCRGGLLEEPALLVPGGLEGGQVGRRRVGSRWGGGVRGVGAGGGGLGVLGASTRGLRVDGGPTGHVQPR